MTVRAFSADGALLDLWTGPAQFQGTLPAAISAHRKDKAWSFEASGTPVVEPKLGTLMGGEGSGPQVSMWAPRETSSLMIEYRDLQAPFGQAPLQGPSLPTRQGGRFLMQPATGAEAVSEMAPAVEGPLPQPGRFESGPLIVRQDAGQTVILLDKSEIWIHGPHGGYRFTVLAQTSPHQRVVDLVLGPEAHFDEKIDPESTVELIVRPRWLKSDDPELAGPTKGSGIVLPEIVASGDNFGVTLSSSVGTSRVRIDATQFGARFAYYVAPEWTGTLHNERTVYIVATPGVRVDEVESSGEGIQLLASPIYVQDPELVPPQGTAIDPSDYMNRKRFGLGKSPRDFVTATTGSSGVTIRDQRLGASVTIEPQDPTKGGRFAWDIDASQQTPTLRILVGKGVLVNVQRARRVGPTDSDDPFSDFITAQVELYEVDRDDTVPPQGTTLTNALLVGLGKKREPNSVEEPLKSTGQVAAEAATDTVLGEVPVVGNINDLIHFGSMIARGRDHWGNEVSTIDYFIYGVGILLPFVGAIGLARRAIKAARGLRAAKEAFALAERTGRTIEEIETMAAHLRRLDPGARHAISEAEQTLSRGGKISESTLHRVESAFTDLGGDLRAAKPRGTVLGGTMAGHEAEEGADAARRSTHAASSEPHGPGAAHIHDESFSANRKYDPSPKHTANSRVVGNRKVSKAPTNGQEALDMSFPFSKRTTRRVGVDVANDEFVIFDRTGNLVIDKKAAGGVYHGHVRSWEELEDDMKKVLIDNGVVDKRGRISVDPRKWDSAP